MNALVVPEKLRDHVRPRRSLPAFVDAPTEKSAKRELALLAKAWDKKRSSASDHSPKEIFELGLATKKDPSLREARRAAFAFLCAPSLEAIRDASIDTLAVAERMAHRALHDIALVIPIAIARGTADAVAVMARTLDLDLDADGGHTRCVFVVTSERDEPSRFIGDWLSVRHVVCAATEADYAHAKKVALAARKLLGPAKRARLAYAFPDETWSRDDAREQAKTSAKDFRRVAHLLSSADDVALAREHIQHVSSYAFDYALNLPPNDALEILREGLVASLVKPKYGPLLKGPPREIVQAISLFATKEAANILAPYLGNAIVGPLVAEYFQENPSVRGALGEVAKGKSKAADAAQRVLSIGKKRETGPRARDEDVPRVLRDRPWRPTKNSLSLVALDLEIPKDAQEHIELTDAERVQSFEDDKRVRDMTAAELKKWRAEVKKKDGFAHADWEYSYLKAGGMEYMRVPQDEGLRAWNEAANRAYLSGTYAGYLAMHGTAAIPGFVRREWVKWLAYQEVGDEPIVEALSHIVSPRIAPVFARIIARRKNFRRPALAWATKHAETAALGLIPSALGVPGEARDDAELTLRLMAQKGAADAVKKSARAYGDKAAAAIDAMLSRDPLAIDTSAPKPPEFLRPANLAAVETKSRARLPDEATGALLEMLRVTPLDPPYAGIALVRDACDAASLGAFARELAEQWLLAGSPGRFEWMLFAVAHFPSDEGTRRVAQLARDWARRDRKKAPRACAVLAAIGDDRALIHLGHIAATSRFDDLRDSARDLLDEAAAMRGLSRDELEDRIVPDLDLGESGTLSLSFGKRSFTIGLDEALQPFVIGEKTFPRASKDDDAVLAKAARARFDALKADTEAIAQRQIRRFESAMVTGRTWNTEDFTTRVAHHPLLRHLARRLVWEAVPEKGALYTFRVDESGAFAGANDAPVTLGTARVRLPHPVRMSEDGRRAWSTLFADYHIIQPFEQLARGVATPTAEGTRIARTLKVPATKALGTLESRGWRRNDRGHVTVYLRALASGGEARLPLHPGISMEDVKSAGEQTIEGVDLPASWRELDPVDVAEITRDLDALL